MVKVNFSCHSSDRVTGEEASTGAFVTFKD